MTALRCKPGDLAVIVLANNMPILLGRLVTIERLATEGEYFNNCGNPPGAVWWVRPVSGKIECINKLGMEVLVDRRPIGDPHLRPIRPNDGVDETLTDERFRVEDVA